MAAMLTGEFAGEWWLPTDPDRKWGGFLRLVDGEQPRLHIAGLISDLQRRLGTVVVEHPAIQGITADGKAVTLVAAAEAGGQMALFHQVSGDTIITAPRAYVGDHFDREGDARFRRLAIRLTYLDSWLPPPLIDRDIDFDRRGRLRRTTLTLRPPRSVTVRLPFGKLTLGHDSAATGDLRTEAKFTQRASIVASTDRRQPLDWWLTTVVRPLRYLLSISTELPISVEEIRLRPWVTRADGEVEVVWSNDRSIDARDELHQTQMLLWAGDLVPRLEPALLGWFAAVSDLEDVFNQFFATYNTSRSFVETRFTMTASSAEAYHRLRVGPPDIPFIRRIAELCRLVPEVTDLMLAGNAAAFARRVRDMRNYRTHLDPRRRAAAAPRGIVELQAQLAVILEAVILHRELGFETAGVAERVARASRLRRLAVAAARAN